MSCQKIIYLLVILLTLTGFSKPDEITFSDMGNNGHSSVVSIAILCLTLSCLTGVWKVIQGLLELMKRNNGEGSGSQHAIKKIWIGSLMVCVPALIYVFNITADINPAQPVVDSILGANSASGY